jgi:pimeloyl-ACP methyl ester carboxylesterase
LIAPRFLRVPDGRRLAFQRVAGRRPGVLFCGGYTSDMTGTKALALETFCRAQGRAFTRFDYSGHGASLGEFAEGTLGLWAEDALAIVDRATAGPLLVVGSSMGGWIMLLAALRRPERVRGLVGIAAAPDFTHDLILPGLTPEQRLLLDRDGVFLAPSTYGEPTPITRRLLEDGERHLLLRASIPIRCPVHLLHGQEDPDVPWLTSLRLAARLESPAVTVELVKDGDHRLSRPEDIDRLIAAVAEFR